MKARPECIVCLFKQALNTAKAVTDDPEIHREVLSRVAAVARTVDLADLPTRISQNAYRIVAEVTGVADPYRDSKLDTNRLALGLLPALEMLEDKAGDRLSAALHLAVAGNVIDLGIGHEFDVEKDIARIMAQSFAIDATEDFRADLKPGKRVMYLGDNSGEIVFDRVLVEELLLRGIEVVFSVKSGPVINDATMEDAVTAGLTALTRVIETGSDDIGVHWDRCSQLFRDEFTRADIVISKGQGNFETCDSMPGNIYFLLKCKCECVADELGAPLGSFVFKHRRG